MSDESNVQEIPQNVTKKARKPYTRRPVQEISQPIPQPAAPNPTVLALESKIYELSEMRSRAQYEISLANRKLQAAQNELRSAQEEFARIEGEVTYRINLLNQMRGGAPVPPPSFGQPVGVGYVTPAMSPTYAPATPYPSYPPAFDPRQPMGVASYPAPNTGLYPDLGSPDGARTESAEDIRRDEMRQRGY